MNIKEDIEKKIINDVHYYLDEIDWDRFFPTPSELSKQVKEEIEKQIRDKVADHITDHIAKEIKKGMPLMDAWTADKIKGIYYDIKTKI